MERVKMQNFNKNVSGWISFRWGDMSRPLNKKQWCYSNSSPCRPTDASHREQPLQNERGSESVRNLRQRRGTKEGESQKRELYLRRLKDIPQHPFILLLFLWFLMFQGWTVWSRSSFAVAKYQYQHRKFLRYWRKRWVGQTSTQIYTHPIPGL